MKVASDFRANARKALSGNWGIAIAAGLIASIVGATDSSGIKINFKAEQTNRITLDIGPFLKDIDVTALMTISGILIATLSLVLVYAVATFIIGSVVSIGYSRFNLDLVDGKEPSVSTLFSYFNILGNSIALCFLKRLFIALWTLLLIVPGIIASLDYSMAEFIMAENTEITASEAIKRSKEMMYGNRWRLFCLELSFIGWSILAAFTFGIGNLWLTPYTRASIADFYREISGTRPEEYTYEINPAPDSENE